MPSERSLEYRLQVITTCYHREEILEFEDGYLRYWPNQNNGAMSSADLRIIAEWLERRNFEIAQKMEEMMDVPR